MKNGNSTLPDWDNTRRNRITDVLYWILLIGGCAVFFLMNLYTTAKEDDLFHSSIGGGSTQPIDSLMDVLRSWVAYYKYDARTANIISFTFNGILGKSIFNVCNTLVFGLMVHCVSRQATARNSAMALVMLYCYIVTALPVPGETLLWVTGAFNYLWNFTASLLLVIYLMKHRDTQPGWLKGMALLLLSMFIGAINEGTTFGVFGGLVLYYLLNCDKVDRTVAFVMTGYLLGVLLLLTCPGAWDRASDEVTHDAGFINLIVDRCRLLLSKSVQYVTPAAAVIVLLLSLVTRGFKKTFTSTPYPLIFLVLLAFAFVVGKDQQRLYFSVSMVGLILVIMAVHALSRRVWWLQLIVIVSGLAICAKYYPVNIRTMRDYQAFYYQVDNAITQTPGRQVVLRTQSFDAYSRFIKYFNFDSWNFLIREETLCRHYDKDNIQFVPDSIYDRYHSGRLLDGAEAVPFSSPDCKDIEAVLRVPGQNYFAVQMHQDTVSRSYQFAQSYMFDGTPTEFPTPYFPLLYQSHEYLIFPLPETDISRLAFNPFTLEGELINLIINASKIPQQTTTGNH